MNKTTIDAINTRTSDKTINQIADEVHENAVNHGFHDAQLVTDDFFNYQTCNLYGEVAELHQAWRSGEWSNPCDKADKMKSLGLRPLTCAEEDYADIVIRVLDQCRRLNIDIASAIEIKHQYNITRPFMHGKKS